MIQPRRYDADGFRRLPFGAEHRRPDGSTWQAHGDYDAAVSALLTKLNDIPAVERSGHG